MKIAHCIRKTLADWYGRDTCVIEVRGYDYFSPYTGRADLSDPDGECIGDSDVIDYIGSHVRTLEGISVEGGEPFRNADLYQFLKKVREFKKPIRICTFGTRPDELDDIAGAMMADDICFNVPAVPGTDAFEKIAPDADPDAIERTFAVMQNLDAECDYSVTAVPGLIDGAAIEAIAKSVGDSGNLTIKQFDPRLASGPDLSKIRPYNKKEAYALSASAKRYAKKVRTLGF